MAVGPLAVMDELSLTLFLHAADQHARDAAAEALPWEAPSALSVLRRLVAEGRTGRAGGSGFYDYPEGQPKSLWKGLDGLHPTRPDAVPQADIRDRFLYVQALEALRCLEEGILGGVAEGNVGSILGLGFPAWTGGTLQFVNAVGTAPFCARAQALEALYGSRFTPPALLRSLATRNEPVS